MFILTKWGDRPIAAVISAILPLPHILPNFFGKYEDVDVGLLQLTLVMARDHVVCWPLCLSLIMIQTSMGLTLHKLRTLRMPSRIF